MPQVRPADPQPILLIARRLGMILAIAALAAALLGAWGLRRVLEAQSQERSLRTQVFVQEVRRCRRASPGPPAPWRVCEDLVRAIRAPQPGRP